MVDSIFGIWLQDLVSFGNPPAALIYYSVCGLDKVYDHFIIVIDQFPRFVCSIEARILRAKPEG